MSGPASLTTSAADVEATASDVSRARLVITSVVMVGSAVASWFAFEALGESGFIGVATAIGVDCALGVWLRVSRRLRSEGIHSRSGTVLEVVAAAMTLYLNLGAAAFPVIPERYEWIPLAVAHTFMPIIMILIGFAGSDAHGQLRALRQHKAVEEKAQAARETQRQQDEWNANQARIKADRDKEAGRAERKRKDDLRDKELDNERHQADLVDSAEERRARVAESVNTLAGALLISSTMQGTCKREASASVAAATAEGVRTMASALLISTILRAPRQRRSPARRQPASPGSPASIASPSPGVRQPASPARRQGTAPASSGASPQVAPDVAPDLARLVKLAKPILAANPGIGRSKLATELAITPYYARRVLDEIDREKEARVEAELQDLINRAIPQNADGENGGTADGRS